MSCEVRPKKSDPGECALQADFDLAAHPGVPPERLIKRAVFDAEKNIAHARRVLEDTIRFWEARIEAARKRCPHEWGQNVLPGTGATQCATCGTIITQPPTEESCGEPEQGHLHRPADQ